MPTKKDANYTGTVTGKAGAGGRGPLGDGAGRAGGTSTSTGTDFTRDPVGQGDPGDPHDFIEDAGSGADPSTGGRDFTTESPPQPVGAPADLGREVPDKGDRHVADSFATSGPGARGTGSIGVAQKPFKNLK